MPRDLVLFAGTANRPLAERVARELGVGLGACAVERFPDGEVLVRLEESVRGREVYVVQPTSPPVNDHLVELLAFADAARRAAAAHVTAVVPYFGYARSDKRHAGREPVMASLVALLLQAASVDHVITVDLHTPQIEGFFHVPVDSLTATPTLARAVAHALPEDAVVVAPDAGRVKMATAFAHRLGRPVAVLHKERASGRETHATHLVGDVEGRACVLVDDIISTGGTLRQSVERLLAAGARPDVTILAAHGLFVGDARARLRHEAVRRIVVTDTVAGRAGEGVEVASVAPLLAGAVRQLQADGTSAGLFGGEW